MEKENSVQEVKRGNSVLKTVKKVIRLLLLLLVIFGCVHFYLKGPEQVVRECVEAMRECDYEKAVDCLDPVVGKQVKAMLNIGNGIVGGLLGVDVDIQTLLPLATALGFENPAQDMEVEAIQNVEYQYKYFDNVLGVVDDYVPDVGKIFAEKAYMTLMIRCNGKVTKEQVNFKKFGLLQGWKIVE